MERFQFRILYRVFLLRVVDLEILSADGDTTKLLGQFAALLAGVSMLFCLPLLFNGGGWHETDLHVMEHLFIATTMLAVGLFSVLSWDSIFPDKRDVLVLAPLPVAPRTIFTAKLSALGCALGVSILALNVFTGLLWPTLFCSATGVLAVARAFAAYWVTLFAAATFMFFSILTIQGLASQLLPRQIFLRISALLQVAAFCLFLGVYIIEPGPATEELLKASATHWLPTYWFFGLFQLLNGFHGAMEPVFAELALRARIALEITVPGATATLMLSYLRTLHKIVEAPDILPRSRRKRWTATLRSSLSKAITLFCLRTMLRSRSHRVILSFYLGVGVAIVLAYMFALYAAASTFVSAPLLAASILMLCVAVGGIRVVASMPIALRANWIFRITELQQPSSYLAAVRRAFVVLGVIPIWLGSAVLFLSMWPLLFVLEHLLILGIVGMILVELCLHSFQKIPFTCSYLPGKGNLQYVFWACAFLLLPLTIAGAQIEMQMLVRPFGYGSIVVALCVALTFARWHTAVALQDVTHMQFEEEDHSELMRLSLNRD